jgi:hypothetical protein
LPSGYSKLVHWVVLEMVTLDLPDSLAALFLVVGIPWVQQKLDELWATFEKSRRDQHENKNTFEKFHGLDLPLPADGLSEVGK